MAKADYQEIIAEYKEQVRVLKEQVNELTDACKAKVFRQFHLFSPVIYLNRLLCILTFVALFSRPHL